jgi:hypothetical protein
MCEARTPKKSLSEGGKRPELLWGLRQSRQNAAIAWDDDSVGREVVAILRPEGWSAWFHLTNAKTELLRSFLQGSLDVTTVRKGEWLTLARQNSWSWHRAAAEGRLPRGISDADSTLPIITNDVLNRLSYCGFSRTYATFAFLHGTVMAPFLFSPDLGACLRQRTRQ